jgi:hypothetical protein
MNVLVTVGTGDLGGELLVVLSQLARVERVFCLVRPKPRRANRVRYTRSKLQGRRAAISEERARALVAWLG